MFLPFLPTKAAYLSTLPPTNTLSGTTSLGIANMPKSFAYRTHSLIALKIRLSSSWQDFHLIHSGQSVKEASVEHWVLFGLSSLYRMQKMHLPTLLCPRPLCLTPVPLREIKPHRCPRLTPMKNCVVLLFRTSDTTNLWDAVHRPMFSSSYHAAARPLPSRFICQTIASASSLKGRKLL